MTTKTAPVNASKNGTAWIGCDVASKTFEAALWLPLEDGEFRKMKQIPVRQFLRTQEGMMEFIEWIDEHLDTDSGVPFQARVVMEATGKYSTELAVWMIAERPELSPAIINPETAHSFIKSLSLRNKTDKIDARALARYGAERMPAPYAPPTPQMAELRTLTRYRVSVIGMRVMESNRLSQSADSPKVSKFIEKHIKFLKQLEKTFEREMEKAVAEMPEIQPDVEALDGIYGVGRITAISIIAEIGDLRRFEDGRQLTAFAGLSPRRNESGTSIHGKTRMSKKGSSRIRKILFMPSLAVIRGKNDMADCYHRLVMNGKKKIEAHGVVMRKLLLVMRAILVSGEKYRSHHRKLLKNDYRKGINT